MKQRLGLEYSKVTPVSAIISNRLVDLQQVYSGTGLLGSITRIQRKDYKSTFNKKDIQYWSDLHISNLVQAYGLNKVVEVYNMIYSLNIELDKSKKIG